MIYISKDSQIHVVWSIFRGTSDVHEDFSRALVKVFLIGNYEKYLLEAVAEGGNLVFDIPQGLPEGAYSLEAIWVKNYNNLLPCSDTLTPSVDSGCRNQPLRWPFKHPHDHRFNDRCIMRSRKDFVFALTEYDSESTFYKDSGEAEIKIRSAVATYGYDGLSAYEIAVLRGDFNGTEGEYLDSLKFKLEVAQEHKLGGITAVTKTDDETEEVKVDPETGRLYVKPGGGGSLSVATETKLGGIKASSKTDNETVEAKIGEDGKLYVPKGGEELKTATETTLGGIKAATKSSLETQEVKIDPATGKLYTQPGGEGGVEIVNNPDEEDLHSVEQSADVHVLQFADKEYNASSFSGLGRVYLRKNISSGKNVLTQAMMSKANTRYVIQYDYDLDGETITLPKGCQLEFNGGKIKNGKIVGGMARISGNITDNIFENTVIEGFNIEYLDIRWFGAIPDYDPNTNSGTDCSEAFERLLSSQLYSNGIPIKIVGQYYMEKGVTTTLGLHLIGNARPVRILTSTSNTPNVVNFPASLIFVKEGITAFTLNGFGGTSVASAKFTNFSIDGINLKSSGKTSVFLNCTTFGSPSRPGYCRNVEASGFDKVFSFTFEDGANQYGTNYYNFTLGDSCNFFENNHSIYSIGRAGTSPSLGGLSIQNNVLEQGASLNIQNIFGYNRIVNNLMEGQESPIRVSLNKGNLMIVGNYFEACTGVISISSSVKSNRITIKDNYLYNNPNLKFNMWSGTLVELTDEFVPENIKLEDVDVLDNSLLDKLCAMSIGQNYPVRFPKFELVRNQDYKKPSYKQSYTNAWDSWMVPNTYFPDFGDKVRMQPINKDTVQLIGYSYYNLEGKIGEYVVVPFYKTAGYININGFGEDSMGDIGSPTVNKVAYAAGYYIYVFKLKKDITQLGIRFQASNDESINIINPIVSILTEDEAKSVKLRELAKLIIDGYNSKTSGTTAQRPVTTWYYNNFQPDKPGFMYFDTDLGKYIVWNGSSWVNLDGTALE